MKLHIYLFEVRGRRLSVPAYCYVTALAYVSFKYGNRGVRYLLQVD